MLTRMQFFIMLLLSIAGTAFAWYLQSFINWAMTLEWMRKIQLYEFLGACVIVCAVILVAWVNERVTVWSKTEKEKNILEEEHKEKVAEKVYRSKLQKQKVSVE